MGFTVFDQNVVGQNTEGFVQSYRIWRRNLYVDGRAHNVRTNIAQIKGYLLIRVQINLNLRT